MNTITDEPGTYTLRPMPITLVCGCGAQFRYEPSEDETRPVATLAFEAAGKVGWQRATCPKCARGA